MRVSKILPVVVRFLIGAIFLVFGANKLLHFIPQPPLPAAAVPFVTGLVASGYMLTTLGIIEVIAGALLIAGRFVPLALTILAPIIVNIALFHTVLAPAPGMVVFLLAAELYLAWVYRDAFRALLQPVAPLADTSSARAGAAHSAAPSSAFR
jgi:putative oxidoreductase